jgi:predicted  nucleic acid-binding Zn-ribbon protein
LKDQLRLIFELNQLDLKINASEESLERIPARREEIETLLQEKKAALEEKTNLLNQIEKEKRDKEGEVALAEARLKEFQGKLVQIKTNKEYQAASKEIAETKKDNKMIEDQILELMTKSETLKKEQQEADESLKASTASFEKERTEMETEEARLKATILEVEQERQKILAQIESSVLGQYHKIKKIRKEAVTFVEGGTCHGCNMHVPPQLYIEIQKSKAVHTCPSCHRILYLPELQKETAPEEVSK